MSGGLTDKKILLVDDDSDILMAMQAVLSDTGAVVETASDGDTAVDRITKGMPDLVVLDMMLPRRSGFLVIERLQSLALDKAPKIIMITGNQGTRHRVYAETLGVDMYLNKPFRMERLLEGVYKLLGVERDS